MRIGWILGWAVPEDWFAPLARKAFPGAGHVFVAATADAFGRLEAAGPFDWVAGYSLGSLLLLSDPGRAARLAGRVALLAPIFAFPAEAGAGGKIPRARVRALAGRLRRDPKEALSGFFSLAGLDAVAGAGAADLPGLLWGLGRLERDSVPASLPEGWCAWCGAGDPLLDAQRLRELEPAVTAVEGAGHHPAGLLARFAASLHPAPSFERAARGYGDHSRVQEAMAAWLAEWLPGARSGRVLEVGAGPGVFTRFLLPWQGPVLATDLSPAMCEAGRKAVPQVEWRPMAAESPATGPWDWIVSSSMLQWAEDPAAVFAAWRSRLAPGGRVLGGLFASGSLQEWAAVAGEPSPLKWRTADAWRGFVAGAGLRVLRDETERRTFLYPSARVFLRSLHGVGGAPARRLPPGRLRRMMGDYEARHRGPDGVGATWVFHRFEASASSGRNGPGRDQPPPVIDEPRIMAKFRGSNPS